jgi:hypothetical protein
MDWDLLFGLTNAVAVAGWLALATLPRTEAVLTAVSVGAIGLLSAVYLALFVGLAGGFLDPQRDASAVPAFTYTVDGLKTMLAARGAILVAWTHYLAFDLFVGLWIARDAGARGIGRWVQFPFFLATFLAGPIGLLAWLLARKRLHQN